LKGFLLKTKNMKHNTIFLFLLIACGTAIGQTDGAKNQLDSQNRKQGYWCKHYPNGNKAYEGWFKDDKPVGEFRRYHRNGELKALMVYSESSPYISTTFFNEYGKKIVHGFYKNQHKDSLWQYYSLNGKLIFEERYTNGLKNGRIRSYYPTGKVMESASYTNGNLNGLVIQFFENGLNKSIIPYTNGEIDGTMKVFNPNGTIKIEGPYIKGLKHGEWKFYDADGKITQTIKYNNGIAENENELIQKESKYLDSLLKNAGKLKEPSIDEVMNSTETRY